MEVICKLMFSSGAIANSLEENDSHFAFFTGQLSLFQYCKSAESFALIKKALKLAVKQVQKRGKKAKPVL